MKWSRILLSSVLLFTLVIAGCGTSNQSSDIKAGTTQMLSVTTDLKAAIDSGDEAKVKALGPKLEDTWSPFEDNVKKKYPDLYKKVEDYLDPTIAGAKASPLDKQALGKLNEELTQALNELAAKEK